jgi:hypothetical protein
MFRRTTRLRDCMVAGKCEIQSKHSDTYAQMREAELAPWETHDDDHGRDGHDFAVFRECYPGFDFGMPSLRFRYAAGETLSDWTHASTFPSPDEQGSVSGQFPFHVLWLSPTVFISSIDFISTDLFLHDYHLSLICGNHFMTIFAYSMSAFQQRAKRQPPSPLPICFLRRLASRLPINYFRDIFLQWKEVKLSPSLICLFLSILPSASAQAATLTQTPGPQVPCRRNYRQLTNLRILNVLNNKQRLAVLSQRHDLLKNDNIRFELACKIDIRDCSPHEAKSALTSSNTALRKSPNVRHLQVDEGSVASMLHENEIPFSTNPCIESMSVDVQRGKPCMLPFYDGLESNQTIKHLYIRTRQGFSHAPMRYFLRNVLPAHPSLEVVHISFTEHLEAPGDLLEQLLPFFTAIGDDIYSFNLLHFSIVNTFLTKTRAEEIVPSSCFQEWWDKRMVPVLALNWYLDQLKKQQALTGPLYSEPHCSLLDSHHAHLSLKVLQLNRGIAYHMTTTHSRLSNMSSSNATVLFRLLHGEFATYSKRTYQ